MKTKLTLFYTTLCVAVLPVLALAADKGIINPLGFKSLEQVVTAVVSVVQVLLIMATVLYLLYAGLMFVTARGEPGKITQARDALLWGMVGAALVIGAQVLVNALQSSVNSVLK